MRSTKNSQHSVKISAVIPSDAVLVTLKDDPKAQKALENIKAKYPHAMTEKVWRHENKISVLIECGVCKGTRFCHSSDLFQVSAHRECLDAKPDSKKAPKGKGKKAAEPKVGGKGNEIGTAEGQRAALAALTGRKAPKGGKAPRKIDVRKAILNASSPASATSESSK